LFASVLAISLLAVVMIPLERPVHAQQQNFNPAQSSSGPPFVATGNGTVNATVAMTQNNIACWGFVDNATGPFTSSTLTYVVNVADNTANSYDLGLYDASGNRIAHTGSSRRNDAVRGHGNRKRGVGRQRQPDTRAEVLLRRHLERSIAGREVLRQHHAELYAERFGLRNQHSRASAVDDHGARR
jgi:hypothetical protein